MPVFEDYYDNILSYQDNIDDVLPPSITPTLPVEVLPTDLSTFPLHGVERASAHPQIVDYGFNLLEHYFGALNDHYWLSGATVSKNGDNGIAITEGYVIVKNVGIFPIKNTTYTYTGYESYTGLLYVGVDVDGSIYVENILSDTVCPIATIKKISGTTVTVYNSIKHPLYHNSCCECNFQLGISRLSIDCLPEEIETMLGIFILNYSNMDSSAYII